MFYFSSSLSSSTWSRSEPSSLTSSGGRTDGPYSASPERTSSTSSSSGGRPVVSSPAANPNISNLAADDEERYEAFGVIDDADSPQGSGSPAASPIAGANPNRNPRSPNSMLLGRHTWLRTSLGRSPAGANRKRLSSNALASQLYRSSSFNSSGRGSICDTADDVYSDVSLEDDVIDLNHRVQMIQEQMHALVDTQSAGEERYARVKQENATLQARILMLEEASKDAEARAEERLETEQRRHREYASRLEREKELQLENSAIKLQAAELECTRSRDEAARLREQLDKLRAEKSRLELALEEAQHDADRAREAEKRTALSLSETNRALKSAEEELALRIDAERRIEEMAQEIENLRARNKNLEESRDELQAAAAALHVGRELLMPSGQDPNDNTINRKNSPSLATELLLTGSTHDQADGVDTGKSGNADICDNFTTLAEAKQALKEQREVNTRLRSYIDNILLNVVENYPQLLEVKQPH
ncbi:rab11 family-interacting protein 4 isoform X2 [Nasonia vitripennis]|uniref:FIP-RBD domain-containing protein n=1 Tax=Nasonia vitripennis TaxID=7425 RepID=A0A7M7Q694_NASVI|nr:rab11 family-interacting protein 4 isoform X2 [Nasonia vitripennis]